VQGINDLQTKADRAAQTYIIGELRKRFPKASIIGEEGDDVSESLDGLVSKTPQEDFDDKDNEILMKTVPDTLASFKEDDVSSI